jgi:DNA-binding phage protein
MPKRSCDWNEGLSEDLKNPDFAQEFIIAAIEDGISLQVALGKVIRAYGVKEFAEEIGMPSPNILRAVNSRHNPTQETLNRLLKPFNLELAVVPIGRNRVA